MAKKPKKPARQVLADEDFVASLETNRDPFRSYLAELTAPIRRRIIIDVPAIAQRYGLDELQLIAVVGGDARPRAMFRDPTGLGHSVKRGDLVSKNRGKIKSE